MEKNKYILMFDEQEFVLVCRRSDFENGKIGDGLFLVVEKNGKILMITQSRHLICLLHHLETVAGSFPNCWANHLLVRFLSTRTTFIRFISFSIRMLLLICAKIIKQFKDWNHKLKVFAMKIANYFNIVL